MENRVYQKKMQKRLLHRFPEFSPSGFAMGATIAFAASFWLVEVPPALRLIYTALAVMQTAIHLAVRHYLVKTKTIPMWLRLVGYVQIATVLVGNLFIAIAGFSMIKKEKSIEYTLSTFSILVYIGVFLVSAMNLFKQYVSATFIPGMLLLIVMTLLQIVVTVLVSIPRKNGMPAWYWIVAVYQLLTGLLGNVFSLLVGLILISRLRHKRSDISIEWIDVLKRLFRNYMSVLGLFVVTFLICLSIFSNLTFDYDLAVSNNYKALLQPPSLEYPFGSDSFGRDVFTRIVFGARISLIVGLISTLVPIAIGGMLGSIAGYYGGKLDNIIMRILDVIYAVPSILLAIAIVAAFGANTFNLIMALSMGYIPIYARTVRATVMGLTHMEYVEAAKACGARDREIIFEHIIPNSLAPVIVRATIGIGGAVLSTSALSYLGLGVEPHIPEWGNILKIGSANLETAPFLAVFPGLAIILIVLAFNYFGDGLRDALDPKLK
ncbi:MAG: ABC transporter permease [Bacillota bacterium]|nr:ABC transporter permease [Bacillota bacterium]